MKNALSFRVRISALAVAMLSGWAFPVSSTSIEETNDLLKMRAIVNASVAEMDRDGRLPVNGIVGGMANNLWQTISHPSDPERMGCGWQMNYLLAKLNGMRGWTFEPRYEVGFSSPIFLPHQWITARGPGGRVLQIDPWDGITEVRK